MNGLSKSLKGANYDEINGALLNVEEAAKKMNDSLLIYPLYGYQGVAVLNPSPDQHRDALEMIKQGLLNKHGLPGAIGFMWLNQKIRYKPNKDLRNEASFKLITDWAAVGIMMHDMPGVYRNDDGTINFGVLRIDCKKDPLSCIISLADILEEFERPKTDFDWYEDKEKNVKHVALSYDFFCIGTIVELVGGKMKGKPSF